VIRGGSYLCHESYCTARCCSAAGPRAVGGGRGEGGELVVRHRVRGNPEWLDGQLPQRPFAVLWETVRLSEPIRNVPPWRSSRLAVDTDIASLRPSAL
jgi:hypothetical protein